MSRKALRWPGASATQPAAPAPEAPAEELPWTTGFVASVGNLKLHLGYRAGASGPVNLFCMEQIGAAPLTMWRNFWVSREAAEEAAENLCAEADDYLDSFESPRRPHEDLDMDDYLEHLRIRVANSFN